MTGFNLPPGCNVSDLPGNSREDYIAEAAYNQVCEQLEIDKLIDPTKVDEEWYDKLVQFILKRMSESRTIGWQAAIAEQQEYEQIKNAEELAKVWQESK
jgi:hypothetical protein